MQKSEYTYYDGNVFSADVMLPCPFCGCDGELYFIGNKTKKGISKRARNKKKAVAKCTNKKCRCEMVYSTLRNDTKWVAEVLLEAWNKRIGGHGA